MNVRGWMYLVGSLGVENFSVLCVFQKKIDVFYVFFRKIKIYILKIDLDLEIRVRVDVSLENEVFNICN